MVNLPELLLFVLFSHEIGATTAEKQRKEIGLT